MKAFVYLLRVCTLVEAMTDLKNSEQLSLGSTAEHLTTNKQLYVQK